MFPEEVVHRHAAEGMRKSLGADAFVHSAGFVYVSGKMEVTVSKEVSESLRIGPGEMDQAILTLFLVRGLAGCDLANHLAYARLQKAKAGKSSLAKGSLDKRRT